MGTGFTRGGFSRSSLSGIGIGLLAFPIWYPVVEEGGLRSPRAGDLPLYALMMAVGVLFILFARRKA
ncbi:MAG: hypothetical protein M3134_02855 [Actinomycetota bacterium]|nr:hypothetical protein [Actinomycetota bacterium]